jgi:Fibronectin type III domain
MNRRSSTGPGFRLLPRHVLWVLLVGLAVVGCGSSEKGPTDAGSDAVALDPADQSALITALESAQTQLAGISSEGSLATQVGQTVLLSGTTVTPIDLAGSALAPTGSRAALVNGAGFAVAFQIDIVNRPATPSALVLSGVLAFQRGGKTLVLTAGPASSSPIPPAEGLLVTGGGAWRATAGQESAQLQQDTGPCPLGTLPKGITSCRLATFTRSGFGITASTPLSAGATGSRTSSLAARSMVGVSLKVDCALGTLCGGGSAAHKPGAPGGVNATPGDGQATVSWTPPSDGGSAITGYTVTSTPGGLKAMATASPAVVTGLTNGVGYTFTVHATNSVGDGPESDASSQVTPTAAATRPGAPTIVSATPGNGQVTVSWTPPLSEGGSAITGYTVTSTPGGLKAMATASPAVVTGLTNGISYTFTVHATNSVGDGPESEASGQVTPTSGETPPGAPTIVSVTAGNAQVTVAWSRPTSDGGSAITRYTVTASPGGKQATVDAPSTEVTVTGLTNGTPYTFKVHATNAVGDGPPSDASEAVTPSGTSTCMEALPVLAPSDSKVFLTVGRVPVQLDSQRRPVVAWVEYGPYVTYVARYDGGPNWTPLGPGFASTFAGPVYVDLALKRDGDPVVAYNVASTTSGRNEIHVSQWNGSAWIEFGTGIPQGALGSANFAVALDASDHPVVAFANFPTTRPFYEIAVATWTGTAWTVRGGIYATAGDQVFNPAIAIDTAGDVTVAWDEEVAPDNGIAVFRPFAQKLSGPGAGLRVSPNTGTDYFTGGPALAFLDDTARTLAMAWSDYPDRTMSAFSTGLQVSAYGTSGWTNEGGLVPEKNGTPYGPHRLVLDTDRHQLAASTLSTDAFTAAIYEYDGATWGKICDDVPDALQPSGKAQAIDATGLAYHADPANPANRTFAIAASSTGTGANQRLFVARVKP